MENYSCIIQKRLVGEKDSKQITSDEYLLAQKGRNDFEEDQIDCFNISYSPLGLRLMRAVNNMPNIFKCLEADVLGGRLGSKKWVQAYFTWLKFSEVGKS